MCFFFTPSLSVLQSAAQWPRGKRRKEALGYFNEQEQERKNKERMKHGYPIESRREKHEIRDLFIAVAVLKGVATATAASCGLEELVDLLFELVELSLTTVFRISILSAGTRRLELDVFLLEDHGALIFAAVLATRNTKNGRRAMNVLETK